MKSNRLLCLYILIWFCFGITYWMVANITDGECFKFNEEINLSLNDFLYFSAVTITTLGYGDILPNSGGIRFLVMIETIAGVIILGLFVSQKFKELNK